MKLILASQSPRRSDLLSRLGVAFEVIPADVDEIIEVGETPDQTALRLSGEKAAAVAADHPEALVVGADTLVNLGDSILGKPKNLHQAKAMLLQLSGNTHFVKTGVSMQIKERGLLIGFVETTAVTFRPLNEGDIDRYLKIDPPLDKAGAYGIQDFSGVFVERIDGCYHNVMGFPLGSFYAHLNKDGLWQEIRHRNSL